jgi:hypothetical protein
MHRGHTAPAFGPKFDGGLPQTHDPAAEPPRDGSIPDGFFRDLGAGFRASGKDGLRPPIL